MWLSGSEHLPSSSLTMEEAQKLVHELHTHQIELELQNEDLRLAQQGLEKSRRKYTDLYEFAPVGFFTIEGNGLIEECNLTAAAMLGYSKLQLLRRSFTTLIPRESQDVYSHFRKRLLISSKKQTCELPLIKEDKSVLYALLESRVRLDINGNAGKLWITVSDISDRKALEDSLRQSTEDWEVTFDSISDCITIIDRDFRIVKANRAAYEMFQSDSGIERVEGRNCYEMFPGIDSACKECLGVQCFQDLSTHSREIYNEKTQKTFQVTCSPMRKGTGIATHIVHIVRDITEQKTMEVKRLQTQKMEAIGTLAGGISHDFNNILTGILGHAEIVYEAMPKSNPSREYLGHIVNAAKRAQELIRQILAFSRKEQDTRLLVKVAPLVQEVLSLIRVATPSSIKIVENLDPDAGPISVNPVKIHQVLMNLCTNAIHAMGKKPGVLTIEVQQVMLEETSVVDIPEIHAGPFVELMVKDTGHGIDRETLDRMFETYFSTKQGGKGSGLGLAIVQGIVKSYGGGIHVESQPDHGTTFRVYFPINEEKPAGPGLFSDSFHAVGDKQICIIDADEVITKMFTVYLEAFGYTITGFNRIETAWEYLSTSLGKFDLIIVDQAIPSLTDTEFIPKVLKVRPDLPIILCTDQESQNAEPLAGMYGVENCMIKPVSGSVLVSTVKDVLDAAAVLQESTGAEGVVDDSDQSPAEK